QTLREIYSRLDSDVDELRHASELRRVLEIAIDADRPDEADRSKFKCRGLVGPGRLLRADEDLRDSGKERPESSELLGCWAVESRRLGARQRQFARRDSVWQRHGRLLPPENRSAMVR